MTAAESATPASVPSPASTRRVVDARGSWCPGPLMELVRVIQEEDVGAEFELLSSDVGSRKDIPLWLDKAHHELLRTEEEPGFDRFIVRKSHA